MSRFNDKKFATGTTRRYTYPQHLDFALDFGHSYIRVDIAPPDEFYGDFFAPLTMKAKFDFAEFAFAQGLQKKIWPKLGYCTARMCRCICYGSWM